MLHDQFQLSVLFSKPGSFSYISGKSLLHTDLVGTTGTTCLC